VARVTDPLDLADADAVRARYRSLELFALALRSATSMVQHAVMSSEIAGIAAALELTDADLER
jgi:hypothetical protein